jgi:hypothetical protein
MANLIKSYAGIFIALALIGVPELADAQDQAKNAAEKKKPAAPTVVVKNPVPIPDNSKLTLMIQLHVAALGLANLTGNYTVLHALGSPTFQAENSPAKLAENFAPFRTKGIDISPAMLFPPILVGEAKAEPKDIIRVAGFYNTSPQRIAFEIAFQAVNNAWRLADIKVQTVVPAPVAQTAPAVTAPAAAPAPEPTPKAGKPPAAKK